MKSINLDDNLINNKQTNSIYLSKRSYAIFVFSGRNCFFPNLKDAKKFLVETSNLFNLLLDDLISINVSVYEAYWKVFIGVDNCTSMILHFGEINNMIVQIFKTKNDADKIYHIIRLQNQIIIKISLILDYITDLQVKSKKYIDVRSFNVLKHRLNNIKTTLDKIGL